MKKANVEKLEHMAATYLQHKYGTYLWMRNEFGDDSREANLTWAEYTASCATLASFGATWNRWFTGKEGKGEWKIENYHHTVKFPTNNQCDKLNLDAWVD